MRQRRGERTVHLPWERRGGLVRRLGLDRLRPLLVALAAASFVLLLVVRERHATAGRATRAALLGARRGLDAYRADHGGKCPARLDDLRRAGYLASAPLDAWGRSLRLVCPGRKDPQGYDLSSDGPDGEPGGLDRIE